MLATSGQQFQDWSAAYRIFARNRIDAKTIFTCILNQVIQEIPKNAPVVTAMDDTILKKTGKKTHGVAYRRDPLGPPFHTNFIRGQRFVQISAAMFQNTKQAAKMVPIDLIHAPTPQKPKKSDPIQRWQKYKEEQKQKNLSLVGVQAMNSIRTRLDQEYTTMNRVLIMSVDGSFTNGTTIKGRPSNTILIGRIRKDAKLYYLPDGSLPRGRKRKYGAQAPTPEEIRQDNSIPYQTVSAYAAGKIHNFKIKTISPLRWRKAGGDLNLRLVVIAPLAYRLSKKARLLYRQPAYLICTDTNLAIESLLQYYLWRWGIEVNFREQKTILGAGQAQVRNQAAVENVPALLTAAYSALLIAAKRTFGQDFSPDATLPPPKWQNGKRKHMSTQNIVNHLKSELWGPGLGIAHFSHFVDKLDNSRSRKKWRPNIESAVLYSNN